MAGLPKLAQIRDLRFTGLGCEIAQLRSAPALPRRDIVDIPVFIAQDSVDAAETVKKLKWPRYPELPATLIGRLARDRAFRGQGIGELLLIDALKRALDASAKVASLAVVVDAKDEEARRFYAKYKFLSLPDERKRLYLPMKTIEKLFRNK